MARIPDSIRHKFQRIIEESKGDERFKKFLANGTDENFKWAYELAYERAYGKAPQNIDLTNEQAETRPTADVLIGTITSLRAELDSLRAGTKVETGK